EVVVIDAFTTDEDGHGTFHQEFPGADISTFDVVLFVGTTASGVIWSQPPDNAVIQFNSTTKTHLLPPGFTSLLADDFHFDGDQQIDRVRWWGGSCSLPAPISTFRIRIHQDDGTGKPGTVVFEQNNVDPDDTPTGATMDCSGAQFQFETDLSSPFIAQGGDTYFFAVAAVAPDGETFFTWNGADATAPDANGNSFTASGTSDMDPSSWSGTGIDQAFELVGTTDTLQLRASGINPG
ncbi:MAG: hypothetical protein IH988_09565, partial [Planctomycetes bacterium]|nr:hypothetical protein [Planctomycetota bacterium]